MTRPRKTQSLLILFTLLAAASVRGAPGTTRPAAAPTTAPEEAPKEPKRIALAGQLPVDLQARRTKVGLLLVQPQINGQDAGWFILDTGAGMSCIDAQLAEKLKLPEAGEVIANGNGGAKQTKFRKYDSLALGPVRIEDSTLVELDLRAISLAIGHPIDGIIGYECFLPAVYEIDFKRERVTIHDPKTYHLPPSTQPAHEDKPQWQPLTIWDRRPCATGAIEGHEAGLFIVDTGANGFVTVHGPAVKKLKLLEGRDTSVSGFGGVGGIRAARKGKLDRFTIAGRGLTGVPTVFSQAEEGALGNAEVQGIVGVQLLEQFRFVVNYPAKTMALLPKE